MVDPGTGMRMEREGREEESSGIHHMRKYIIEDHALPFRTRHPLCRQRVASVGSQQLRAHDPAFCRV